VDRLQRYLEGKRKRLEEVQSDLHLLEDRIASLRDEETKLRSQVEVAEEMAREMAEDSEDIDTPPAVKSVGRRSPRKRKAERKAKPTGISLIEAIRLVARDLSAPFSTGEVKQLLQQRYPELLAVTHHSSVSGTMRRMDEKGDLTVVERGGPGKEATYRLPAHPGVERRLQGAS
jgi:hypothetical protein